MRNGVGSEIASKYVDLDGGESTKVNFSMTNLSIGQTYTVNIGDLSGEFRVQSVGVSPTVDQDEGGDAGIYLLGLTVVIAAVLLVIVIHRNR